MTQIIHTSELNRNIGMELNITVEEVVVICDKLLALKDRPSVSNSRMVLFRQFNGDVFYKQSLWPGRYRQLFFKKPLTDLDTFKLMLFLLGNGASPHLTIETKTKSSTRIATGIKNKLLSA